MIFKNQCVSSHKQALMAVDTSDSTVLRSHRSRRPMASLRAAGVTGLLSSPADCGGLIEASGRRCCSRTPRRLPPQIAGASLKHRRARLGEAAARRLPPQIAGASLKHSQWHQRRRRSARLPPQIAGASLKQPRAAGPRAQHGRLPPQIAGASLKQAWAWRGLDWVMASSPADCGGLIEASTGSTRRSPSAPVFPRRLRGPH